MKRCVCLGMGNGDLWLALAGEQVPADAVKLDAKDARFWLRQSVPPMAHPTLLHAISDIADALGYPFHGAAPFADHEWVLDALASALADKRLVAFRLAGLEGGGKAPVKPVEPPKPKPAPTPVNPIIEPAKLVVVVKKLAKDPTDGVTKPYTHPKRQAVTLKTDAAFEGTGTFTCDKPDRVKFFSAAKGGTEIKFDGTANVFKPKSAPAWAPKGATLSSGVTVFVEGAKPSDAMDDITLKLALSGGPKPTGPDDSSTLTSVEVTLDIHKSKPDAKTAPVFSTDDKVHVGRNLLVQDAGNHFVRAKLLLKVKPAKFTGEIVVKAKNGHVDAFKDEAAKAGQASALPFKIAGDKIAAAGEILWGQGVMGSPSKDMLDSGFIAGITSLEDEADKVTATAVEIRLDICKTRTKAQATATPKKDPDPLAQDDKGAKLGRFIHEQDLPGKHHGRALLIVQSVKPAKFKGKLTLESLVTGTGAAELFPNERPTAGEAVTAVPHDFDYSTEKNEDKKLWVEGKTVSSALRNINYFLHLKDDPVKNSDTVMLTVAKFSDLKADIPSTPPQTARAGNAAARHTRTIAGTTSNDWDFDDANNRAIVLIEDSVRAANQIKLSVKVKPAGVPVSWDMPRDIRGASQGDNVAIRALSGNPTHRADVAAAADPLKRELIANGVGTFHISPFIDCNGSNAFEPTQDLEPYLVMNLVLVRVEGKRNDSISRPGAVSPAAPTSATGCRVQTGTDPPGAPWTVGGVAAYSKATVKVIGGGKDGLRGLDRVFAGWGQHIAATGTSASVPQGLDIFAQYLQMVPAPPMPPPLPALPPIPTLRRQFFIFTQSVPVGAAFGPPPAVPPVVEAAPVLDVTPLGAGADGVGGDSCTGQWGGHGPFTTPIPKVNKTIGQEWTVDTGDSPSVGLGPAHPFFPGATMVAFRFNIDFRVDLLFWTNTATPAVSTPTGDPADNLYSSVQTNNWTVRFSIAFNPTTGAPVGAVPATVPVVMTKDPAPTRRATPVDGMNLETRGPSALALFRRDARA